MHHDPVRLPVLRVHRRTFQLKRSALLDTPQKPEAKYHRLTDGCIELAKPVHRLPQRYRADHRMRHALFIGRWLKCRVRTECKTVASILLARRRQQKRFWQKA